MRKMLYEEVVRFYSYNKIGSMDELSWIVKRGIILTKCHLDFDVEGNIMLLCSLCYINRIFTQDAIYFCLDIYVSNVFITLAVLYPNLTEIKGRQINEAGMKALGTIKTLRSVEFTDATSTICGVLMLCSGYANLKCLKLFVYSKTYDSEYHIDHRCVTKIAKRCPGLTSFSLHAPDTLTDEALWPLWTLTYLKELDLTGYSDITSMGVQNVMRSIGAKLEVLVLSNVTETDDGWNSTCCDDALLRCIGEYCPKLREFAVSTQPGRVSDAAFTSLFQGCPLLETLRCKKLTAPVLIDLAEYCPRLLKLILHWGYTDTGITAVAS